MSARAGKRVPDETDRRRQSCSTEGCEKLLFRFHPDLTGGPIEMPCPLGHMNEVYFNTMGPAWDPPIG